MTTTPSLKNALYGLYDSSEKIIQENAPQVITCGVVFVCSKWILLINTKFEILVFVFREGFLTI